MPFFVSLICACLVFQLFKCNCARWFRYAYGQSQSADHGQVFKAATAHHWSATMDYITLDRTSYCWHGCDCWQSTSTLSTRRSLELQSIFHRVSFAARFEASVSGVLCQSPLMSWFLSFPVIGSCNFHLWCRSCITVSCRSFRTMLNSRLWKPLTWTLFFFCLSTNGWNVSRWAEMPSGRYRMCRGLLKWSLFGLSYWQSPRACILVFLGSLKSWAHLHRRKYWHIVSRLRWSFSCCILWSM